MIYFAYKFKILRKRCMTMLELLIAMALTAVLLTTLTYFYQELGQLNTMAERKEKEGFLLRYAEIRLSTIVPHILAEFQLKDKKDKNEIVKEKEKFFFFTSGDLNGLLAPNNPSLLFVYNTGVDMDTHKADRGIGRLYLDKEHRFCMATWPMLDDWEESHEVRKEVLLEGVEGLRFQFYMPPAKDRSIIHKKDKEETEPVEIVEGDLPRGQWTSEWPRDNKILPAMLKITLTLSRKDSSGEPAKITFAFPLTNSQELIVYGDKLP